MAKKLKDDEIRYILSLDAKGVQSTLTTLSSKTQEYEEANKRLSKELSDAEKQMKATEKEMRRMEASGKDQTKAYQELEATLESVNSDIADYRKQMTDNKKAIETNKQKVEELTKSLKIEEMTMSQLRTRAKELERQLNNTSKSADPAVFNALEKELKAVRDRMGEVKKGSQDTFTVFKGGLAVLAGNLMTKAISAIGDLVSEGKEWVKVGIDMAKQSEGTINYFKKLADSDRILQNLKNSTDGTISSLELMKKTLRAKEMGIPIENMASLMQYARIQATKLGKDVDYMANSIVDGIGRKSTLVLDNLGLSATRVQAEVKKSGDFTQAVLKIVSDELENQGTVALTAGDKAAQAAAKWEDAQLRVGQKFQWVGEIWDKMSGKIADSLIQLTGSTKTTTEAYDDQLAKVADLEINTRSMAERYDVLKSKTELSASETEEMNKIMNVLSNTIPGVVTEFDKYGNALSINTAKVYAYIEAEKARLKYVNKEAIEDTQKDIDKTRSEMEKLQKELTSGKGFRSGLLSPGYYTLSEKALEERQQKLNELSQKVVGAEAELARLSGKSVEDQIENQKKLVQARTRFTEMNHTELEKWIADEKNAKDEYLSLAKQILEQKVGTNPDINTKKKKPKDALKKEKDEQNLELEKLENTHLERLRKIREDYAKGEIKTEADYKNKLFAQEQSYMILRENLLEQFIKKTSNTELKSDLQNKLAEAQNKRLDQEIKFRADLEKIILDADPLKKEEVQYQERLSAVGLFGVEKEKMTADQLKALELLEKQHQDNIDKINTDAENKRKAKSEKDFEDSFNSRKEELQTELNELTQNAAANGKSSFDAEMEVHIKRLQMLQEEIAARKESGLETIKQTAQIGRVEAQMTSTIQKEMQKRANEFKQYGQSVGTALGQVMTGQENALKAFGDVTIDVVFDVLSKIIEAEMVKVMATSTSAIMRATAESMATPQSALTFGASGFATAAILTGAITAATVAAKTALKGLLQSKKGSSSSSSSSSNSGSSSGQITPKQRSFADGGYNDAGITGGYTGDGGRYEFAGLLPNGAGFHRGEYIIPDPVLRLPAAAPMVRALESMRQPYSSDNPLPDRFNKGFADGGYNGSDPSSEFNTVVFENGVMIKLLKVLDKLEAKGVRSNIGVTELQAEMKWQSEVDEKFTQKK